MENFEQEYQGGYSVNLSKVIESQKSLAVTRMLASDLMKQPYMQIGDFFKNISDSDLVTLVDAAEPNSDNMDELLLIAMMLRTAEGLEAMENEEEGKKMLGQLVTMLVMESLYRKGLIKLYRENMSFGDDMGDKIVAEKV